MKTRDTKAKLNGRIDMKTKQLGNSDLFITPLGFGAWAIGGSGWEFGWGEQDDKESVAAIHRALELCINKLVGTSAVRFHQMWSALGRARIRSPQFDGGLDSSRM